VLWLAFGNVPCWAGGAVYAHVDPVSGMVVLNNVPPGARAAPAQAHIPDRNSRALLAAFARVSPARQREMDADRRAILENELNEERRALAVASAGHAAGDVRARHAANIAALQRELAHLTSKQVD
jgi:hypothetical protein